VYIVEKSLYRGKEGRKGGRKKEKKEGRKKEKKEGRKKRAGIQKRRGGKKCYLGRRPLTSELVFIWI